MASQVVVIKGAAITAGSIFTTNASNGNNPPANFASITTTKTEIETINAISKPIFGTKKTIRKTFMINKDRKSVV